MTTGLGQDHKCELLSFPVKVMVPDGDGQMEGRPRTGPEAVLICAGMTCTTTVWAVSWLSPQQTSPIPCIVLRSDGWMN